MADPMLRCPPEWLRGTLEPMPSAGLIERVESGGTPGTSDDECWDGGIPWLTPRDVTKNEGDFFVSTTERTLTERGLRMSAAKLMPPGTVMLTKRAPVGVVAVNVVPMATNQGFLNFVCGPRLRAAYLAWWLLANRRYLDHVANGSTYPELYKGDLFEFELAVPSLDAQDRILALLSSLRFIASMSRSLLHLSMRAKEITEMQSWARQCDRLIDDLLPPLLSGSLDVSQVRIPSPMMERLNGERRG